jgi:hypothetical protein
MHLIGVALLSVVLTADADDVFVRRLREVGVEPTPAGLAAYFDGIAPSEAKLRRIEGLIRALGSPDYEERVRAMAELPRIHPPPFAALREAARSADRETGRRAARVLSRLDEASHRQTLLAAFRTIERRRLKGLAQAIAMIDVPDGWRELDDSAVAAFTATAREVDLPLVRRLIQESELLHQRMGLAALSELVGLDAVTELAPLLGDENPVIRLAAARGLAGVGSRECLPTLVALLEANDATVREDAADVLRRLTGQRFGFSGYGSAETRRESAGRWKEWVARNGQSAPLAPYRRDRESTLPDNTAAVGRTLVCLWEMNTILEYDGESKQTWSVGGFEYVWGCWGTPEGHRLVCDADRTAVIEYDAAGKECWRVDKLPGRPTDVQRLGNGNTLIALADGVQRPGNGDELIVLEDGGQVVEVNRRGETVWKYVISGRPTTVQRLRDGRTVINLQNSGRVVAVDPDGNAQTLLDGLDRPHTAQMLDNGNILVCEMELHRIDEYDQEGRLVWRKDRLQNPAQAQRLSNGNTLISDSAGIHEFDPAGELVSQIVLTDPKDPSRSGRSRFHRY